MPRYLNLLPGAQILKDLLSRPVQFRLQALNLVREIYLPRRGEPLQLVYLLLQLQYGPFEIQTLIIAHCMTLGTQTPINSKSYHMPIFTTKITPSRGG